MTPTRRRSGALLAMTPLALAACGGSNNATISGSVSGLNANTSVVLENEGGDSLTVSSNGTFNFATGLPAGSVYNVTVLTEPAGEICLVENGSGSVDLSADSVDTVSVVCATTQSLAGTVSGLAAGTSVVLSDGQVLLPVATNGAFSFPGTFPAGTSYAVTVSTQPSGETCTVANGTGSVTAAGIPAIVVTCS